MSRSHPAIWSSGFNELLFVWSYIHQSLRRAAEQLCGELEVQRVALWANSSSSAAAALSGSVRSGVASRVRGFDWDELSRQQKVNMEEADQDRCEVEEEGCWLPAWKNNWKIEIPKCTRYQRLDSYVTWTCQGSKITPKINIFRIFKLCHLIY